MTNKVPDTFSPQCENRIALTPADKQPVPPTGRPIFLILFSVAGQLIEEGFFQSRWAMNPVMTVEFV